MQRFSPRAISAIREVVRQVLSEHRNTLPHNTRRAVVTVGGKGALLYGKTVTSIAQDEKGDVVIWEGPKGEETESNKVLEDVYNRGNALPADKPVFVAKIKNGYEIVYRICDRVEI